MLHFLESFDFFSFLQHYGAIVIFVAVIIALVTEVVEHALSASIGALLMILL